MTSPRLLFVSSALLLSLAGVPFIPAAANSTQPAPTPQQRCDEQSLPESGVQGRVPGSEVASGRAAQGYRCNTVQVAQFLASGGYQVHRYVDRAGRECAIFDSTLLFPRDAASNAAEGQGVYIMDMSDPANPQHTATLSTPAMLSPHESLRVNSKRGLIAAVMGSPSFNPGVVDVYDASTDCRRPVLQSSTPVGVVGHESAFSPDGTVLYASGGHAVTAVDLANPKLPNILWFSTDYSFHGMNVSDDGNRLYVAQLVPAGLTILDVSEINQRKLNPAVTQVSYTTWPEISIPQNVLPITIKGHPYLIEIDEYSSATNGTTAVYNPAATVGAARIIDIADEERPRVISNMRLAVHQTAARGTDQMNDPGAQSPVQGYAAHNCAVPQRQDPTIVACSFILSGLRVFDIKDPFRPREIGYFNGPIHPGTEVYDSGAFAMSAPVIVPSRNEIWHTDGNTGFYVVRLTAGAFAANSAVRSPSAASSGSPSPATIVTPTQERDALPSTGLVAVLPWLGLGLVTLAALRRLAMRRRHARLD